MIYDVVIIGAGPAGLMAAGRAGELGGRCLLLEKNSRAGAKLLLTGGGRCNITNNITDPKLFAARLGSKGKFLISALSRFGAVETMEFFKERGLELKTENNKIFPQSGQAPDVLKTLAAYCQRSKVDIRLNSEVKEFRSFKNKIEKIILASGEELKAKGYIIAAGGKSYPETGSSGWGYEWLKRLGHTVIEPRPALTPILVKEKFIRDIEGISLDNIKISLKHNSKNIASLNGDVIFTAEGLSGPAIMDLSRLIEPEISDKLIMEIDFFPEVNAGELDKKLSAELAVNGKKLFKNILSGWLPLKLASALLKLAEVNENKKSADITKADRLSMLKLLKSFQLNFKSLAGFDKAMITKGGVSLKEIDPKTMRSKIISNLFLAGEIIDLDGPTGGYNLQIAWSTGYLAGQSAVDKKEI